MNVIEANRRQAITEYFLGIPDRQFTLALVPRQGHWNAVYNLRRILC